jgi:nicotinamide riboside transporter PnuC
MEDRGPTVFTVTLVLSILATVFVALRLVSKWCIVKRSNSDDVFMIIAWVSVSSAIVYSKETRGEMPRLLVGGKSLMYQFFMVGLSVAQIHASLPQMRLPAIQSWTSGPTPTR